MRETRRASVVAATVVGVLFPLLAALRVLPILDALRDTMDAARVLEAFPRNPTSPVSFQISGSAER